jgi:hypothetical protein
MASDDEQPGCPLRRLQELVDRRLQADGVPEGEYLDACAALKELHSATKLYKLTILEFYVEEVEVPEVSRRTRTIIMETKGEHDDDHYARTCNWHLVLDRNALPHDTSNLKMDAPFEMRGKQMIVTSLQPYLKRGRDDDDQ